MKISQVIPVVGVMLASVALLSGQPRCQAQTIFPTAHTFFNNVPYVSGGTTRQVMDIYIPVGATGPVPVVLYIHGGGWNQGAAENSINDWDQLGQGSFAIAAVNYRLNTVVEPLVTQVDDMKAAIRFVKANATAYGIDATKVGVMGQSAGAHLSGLAALSSDLAFLGSASDLANTQNLSFSSDVQAVVSWALPPIPPSGNQTLTLSTYIGSGDPDFQMFHSVDDLTVNISFPRNFRNSMIAAGLGVTLSEISGNHFPSETTRDTFAPVIVTYFNQEFAAIPEPSTGLLIGGSVFAAIILGSRKMRLHNR